MTGDAAFFDGAASFGDAGSFGDVGSFGDAGSFGGIVPFGDAVSLSEKCLFDGIGSCSLSRALGLVSSFKQAAKHKHRTRFRLSQIRHGCLPVTALGSII